MASTTYVRNVLYRVSVLLHDISPQFTRWTQREMIDALNDGCKAIAKYLPSSCSRTDTIRLSPGTMQTIARITSSNIKPGDGSAAADVSGNFLLSVPRNMGADGLTPGRAIRICDREVLDVNSPDWHTKTATAVSQYTFDPRTPKTFFVSPGVPSGTAVWVMVSYLADPVEVPNSGDYGMDGTNTTLAPPDDKNIDDLVNYIVARMYMKGSDFAENMNHATAATQLFVASINAQATALTGVNPNLRALPFNPTVSASTA